jgi:ABC-type Zn uptake system ZnuABC Zn-binding protein ZnuA
MKKVLIISPIPVSYPPKDGYSMVVFYRSYFLKKLVNIQSDIIVSENEEYSAKNLVDSGVFHNVFSYPMNKKWKSLIKSIYSRNIYYMLRFDINNKYLNNIINFIKYEQYYAVFFEHSFSYPLYQKLIKNINVDKSKIIYSSHNIDYIDFKNLTYENKNLFKKIFYWITYKKLKKN